MGDHFYVWALSKCPFCIQAAEELITQKSSFSVFVMDDELDYLEALKESRDWSTVPLILRKEKDGKEEFIGGFTDLKKWFESRDNE